MMESFNILQVEDNPGDIELTPIALSDTKLNINHTVVEDGQEALNYLYQKGQYKEADLPDIILLDLNLPKCNGHEVLKTIKSDQDRMEIPIIIFTSSEAPIDITESYHLRANCFLSKPVDLDKFMGVIDTLREFWSETACLYNEST